MLPEFRTSKNKIGSHPPLWARRPPLPPPPYDPSKFRNGVIPMLKIKPPNSFFFVVPGSVIISEPFDNRMQRIFSSNFDELHLQKMQQCYIFITGGQLLDRIKTGQARISERDVLRIVRDLGSAIAYIHSMGIIHRDIKLENMMYS